MASFHHGGDIGCGGSAEPDGIRFLDGENGCGGFAEQFGVVAGAAAERFKRHGIDAPLSEEAGQCGGDPGFANVGGGSGDEEPVCHAFNGVPRFSRAD